MRVEFGTGVRILVVLAIVPALVCTCRRQLRFQVVPSTPQYLLRFPDLVETPLQEILEPFQNMSEGWVELSAPMELRVERAYFSDPAQRTIANYVGTEAARYAVLPGGELRLLSLESLPASERSGEPAVDELITASERRRPHHRLFLQVLFDQGGEAQRAILLSAESRGAMERLTMELLRDPESVCSKGSSSCTVFPVETTAAPDIPIVVDGEARSVPWTTRLATIAGGTRSITMRRVHNGVLTPVELDPSDPESLALFLLPGDDIRRDRVAAAPRPTR